MSKLVKFPNWDFGFPLIKSPNEVLSLFRFNSSPRFLLKSISKQHGVEHYPISDRSLDNLTGKGVSEKTMKLAFEHLVGILPPGVHDQLESIFSKDNSSIFAEKIWKSCFLGFEIMFGSNDLSKASIEQQSLESFKLFIFERCEYIERIQRWIDNIGGDTELKNGSNPAELMRLTCEFTRLPDEHKTQLVESITKFSAGGSYESHDTNVASCYLNADFNLALFALIDKISLDFKYQHRPEEREPTFLLHVFGMEARCYFGRLIKFIKQRSGCSNAHLASLIPVNQMNEASGRTELDIQKERLKEWASGKSRPSNETLVAFSGGFNSEDQFLVYAYSHVCLAIDGLIASSAHKDILVDAIYTDKNFSRYL